MKPLRERNQAAVGGVTLVLIVAVALAAFYAERLPFIGSAGTEYTAQFAESAGLSADDEVRVAGIRVGKVMKVGLDKGRVVVAFRVDGVRVGDQSRVGIEIKTLLGEKFLAVRPAGTRDQDPDTVIPVARTSTPFEIPDAFGQLSSTVDQINTTQLAQSFRVLATTFANTPDEFGKTLNGLSRLSETIASRDKQLTSLLASASTVSGVLAGRNDQVRKLVTDGAALLDELNRRKDAINTLLVGTQRLADELRGLVKDNQDQLKPALEELDGVTQLLQRNQDALQHGVAALAPYVRASNNLVGNGRWFDGALCGLLSPTINVQGLQLNPGTCGPPETKGEALPTGGRK